MADSIFGDIAHVAGSTVGPIVDGMAASGLADAARMMGEMNGQMGQLIDATHTIHDAMQHVVDTVPLDAAPGPIAPDAPVVDPSVDQPTAMVIDAHGYGAHDAVDALDAVHDGSHDAGYDVQPSHDAPYEAPAEVYVAHTDASHADAYHADDATG